MRVAAIDIGTNTVLLLVADGEGGRALRAVMERATITRLGEGVDRTRRLSPAAVARTRECLEEYSRAVQELRAERVSVVGTSAMRDASGGEELRECVRVLFGVEARVLSGEQEALFAFRGATSGMTIAPQEDVAVFDIGGGSTEVVVGRTDETVPRIAFWSSFDVGSVRLTERHAMHDPPTTDERAALMRAAQGAFVGVPRLPLSSTPVGIAGTMTTLAAISLGLGTYDAARVHGHVIAVADLRRVIERLASVGLEERKRVPGMEPMRADVIVAGGTVALALLDHWKVSAVRISDRGVRWGVAQELVLSGVQPLPQRI
jgi:exopolyphosphatase/guanosine-5'-triphosphate,3'-diphosphate pyrophosphatase